MTVLPCKVLGSMSSLLSSSSLSPESSAIALYTGVIELKRLSDTLRGGAQSFTADAFTEVLPLALACTSFSASFSPALSPYLRTASIATLAATVPSLTIVCTSLGASASDNIDSTVVTDTSMRVAISVLVNPLRRSMRYSLLRPRGVSLRPRSERP